MIVHYTEAATLFVLFVSGLLENNLLQCFVLSFFLFGFRLFGCFIRLVCTEQCSILQRSNTHVIQRTCISATEVAKAEGTARSAAASLEDIHQ